MHLARATLLVSTQFSQLIRDDLNVDAEEVTLKANRKKSSFRSYRPLGIETRLTSICAG